MPLCREISSFETIIKNGSRNKTKQSKTKKQAWYEELRKERHRKVDWYRVSGYGLYFAVLGAIEQLNNNCKSILAQQCTYLVEEVDPLAEREKKRKPVI